MVSITEITVISVDRSEDSWAIEGEILFESDLSTPFSVTYYPDDDDFEELEIEINPGDYDKKLLKEMIIEATINYED